MGSQVQIFRQGLINVVQSNAVGFKLMTLSEEQTNLDNTVTFYQHTPPPPYIRLKIPRTVRNEIVVQN